MSEKIKKILEEIRPEFNFAESEDFIEDGYLDSFDMVTLIAVSYTHLTLPTKA